MRKRQLIKGGAYDDAEDVFCPYRGSETLVQGRSNPRTGEIKPLYRGEHLPLKGTQLARKGLPLRCIERKQLEQGKKGKEDEKDSHDCGLAGDAVADGGVCRRRHDNV